MACKCGTSNNNCLCAILEMPVHEQKVQVFENTEPTYEFLITAGTLPEDTSKIRVIVGVGSTHLYANPGINFDPVGFTVLEGNKIYIWDNGGLIVGSHFVRVEFFETKTVGDLVDCSDISCS